MSPPEHTLFKVEQIRVANRNQSIPTRTWMVIGYHCFVHSLMVPVLILSASHRCHAKLGQAKATEDQSHQSHFHVAIPSTMHMQLNSCNLEFAQFIRSTHLLYETTEFLP
jgi:hypothetical protein